MIDLAPCFTPSTRIETPRGQVAVEALSAGDAVALASGGVGRVRWVGHRRATEAAIVRVRVDALGHGTPGVDLCLSADHALFIDGALVPAHLLFDGTNIVDEIWPFVMFYHVELDEHAILLAEGVPAESYLDTGNRTKFANCALSYDPSEPGVEPCAEMVVAGARLERIRASLPAMV